MTLAEALALIAVPVSSDPETNALRAEAARVVFDYLQTSGRAAVRRRSTTRHARAEEVEDAIQDTLLCLARGGARGAKPSSDKAAAYICKVLLSKVIDILRRRLPAFASAGEDDAQFDPLDPRDEDRDREANDAIAATRAAFWDLVLPDALASFARAAEQERFRRDVDALLALAEGHVAFADLVEAPPGGLSPDERKKAENALYKRHSRARRRLLEAIAGLSAAGRITPELRKYLEGFVGGFLNRGPAT
jgi:hypothetical protein